MIFIYFLIPVAGVLMLTSILLGLKGLNNKVNQDLFFKYINKAEKQIYIQKVDDRFEQLSLEYLKLRQDIDQLKERTKFSNLPYVPTKKQSVVHYSTFRNYNTSLRQILLLKYLSDRARVNRIIDMDDLFYKNENYHINPISKEVLRKNLSNKISNN